MSTSSSAYPLLPGEQGQEEISLARPQTANMSFYESRPPSFSQPHNSFPVARSKDHAAHSSGNFRSFGETSGHTKKNARKESPQIYTAVYSSIAVYEMEVDNVAVMRRRSDSWLNATQLLKVAGVEKGKRTKILEKEIHTGSHEKVQGGYGRYQGTWINYNRGREFCRQYGVEEVLRPLLEYDIGGDGRGGVGKVDTPTKEQAMAANRKRFYSNGVDGRAHSHASGGTFFQNISPTASNALAAMKGAARYDSPMPRSGSGQNKSSQPPRRPSQLHINSQDSQPAGSQNSNHSVSGDQQHLLSSLANERRSFEYAASNMQEPPRKRMRPSSSQEMQSVLDPTLADEVATEVNDSFAYSQAASNAEQTHTTLPPMQTSHSKVTEEKRFALLDLFADSSRTDFSGHTAMVNLSGRDLDIPLDASANTALHWAATLARVSLVRLLISRGANMLQGNAAGQTPLMAAVQVNNCLDHSCFTDILEALGTLIDIRDATGRTVLHHIAVSSGIKGRSQSSRYYLESLLEFTVRQGGSNPTSQQNSFSGTGANHTRAKAMNLGRFMSEVVNIQDKAGNTALNLVARIGNRAIINQLEEVGADFDIPNGTGFKPSDFGILPARQTAAHQDSSQSGETDKGKTPSQMEQIKEEIFATATSILSQTQLQYSTELAKKQSLVDQQNAELISIASQQKVEIERLESLRKQKRDREERKDKIANLRRAMQEWKAKRPDLHSPNGDANNDGTALQLIDPALLPPEQTDPSSLDATDALGSEQQSYLQSLPSSAMMRAQANAIKSNNTSLGGRVAALKARSLELEDQYRRVVSLCTGVDESKVDTMLEGLLAAVESEEKEAVEVGRVRDFLRKVEGVVEA
ncbi:MAG: transcriptional regulator swi6 [Chrysothrix sp. TS-e1954]|nr:MAG: transcriptional regulator swi6 [Chrysothrix sp. TS-e1954]